MELSYLAILLEHFDYALLPFSARLAGQSPSRHDRALGKLPSCPIGWKELCVSMQVAASINQEEFEKFRAVGKQLVKLRSPLAVLLTVSRCSVCPRFWRKKVDRPLAGGLHLENRFCGGSSRGSLGGRCWTPPQKRKFTADHKLCPNWNSLLILLPALKIRCSENWAERSGGLKPRPFRTAFSIVK